jgi:hypothetical protein
MDELLYIALLAVLLGATSAGLTVMVRAMPFVARWVDAGKKPWACDVCMTLWVTAALAAETAWHYGDATLLTAFGPAYPWAMWVLRKITDHHGFPPLPLEDSDDA